MLQLQLFFMFHYWHAVSMPRYFPKEQPKLTFRSIYHTDDSDKPFSKNSRSYPWSPRWSSQEMITRLKYVSMLRLLVTSSCHGLLHWIGVQWVTPFFLFESRTQLDQKHNAMSKSIAYMWKTGNTTKTRRELGYIWTVKSINFVWSLNELL